MEFKEIFQPQTVVDENSYSSEMNNTSIYRVLRYLIGTVVAVILFTGFAYSISVKHNYAYSLSVVLPLSVLIVLPVWAMLLSTERKKINVKISNGIVSISIEKLTGSHRHRFKTTSFDSIESHQIWLKDNTDIRTPVLYWVTSAQELLHLDRELVNYSPLGKFLLHHLENKDEDIELNLSEEQIEPVATRNHQTIFDA